MFFIVWRTSEALNPPKIVCRGIVVTAPLSYVDATLRMRRLAAENPTIDYTLTVARKSTTRVVLNPESPNQGDA